MTNTLAQLIESAARAAPTNGLIDVDGTMRCWPELLDLQVSLAGALIERGVEPGDRVVVVHPKTVTSFVAIHAIQYCGAIAVPLDPRGAPNAIARVVESVEPAAVITASSLIHSRLGFVAQLKCAVFATHDRGDALDTVIDLDRVLSESAFDVRELQDRAEPDEPAYIIFTSGSTGTPKGIVHTHRSGLSYAELAVEQHRLDTGSRLAATAPFHFDMSTLELYAVPMAAATSITVSEPQLLFPASLTACIEDNRATHLYAVPYQLRQLHARGELGARDLTSLIQISFGGEQFSEGALTALSQAIPQAELLNYYGPAEVNGVVTHNFGIPIEPVRSIPIGQPLRNVRIDIVDDSGRPIEPGDIGELLVQSPTAMVGYWRMPERTAASFTTDSPPMYRTGDLVHVDSDGLLFFHGRKDNRVKVRGVRIELEEIERVVGDVAGVIDAIAGVDRRGENEGVHVWLLTDAAEVDHSDIVQHCRTHLPNSAIPSSFEIVATVPETQSGKIDRVALRRTLEKSGEDDLT